MKSRLINILINLFLCTLVYAAPFIIVGSLFDNFQDESVLSNGLALVIVALILCWLRDVVASLMGRKNVLDLLVWLPKGLRYGLFGALIAGTALAIVLWPSNQEDSQISQPLTTGGNTTQNTISVGDSTLTQPTAQESLASLKNTPSYQNPQTGISYEELFRNSEKYQGEFLQYTGKVIQVQGEPGNWTLRVNITKGEYGLWKDTVLIQSYSQERAIDDDIITFTAVASGVYTYQAVFGQDITLPLLGILEHTVVGRD